MEKGHEGRGGPPWPRAEPTAFPAAGWGASCRPASASGGTFSVPSADVDECQQEPPPCGSGHCENVPGGYRCLCPTGFRASLTEDQCLGEEGRGWGGDFWAAAGALVITTGHLCLSLQMLTSAQHSPLVAHTGTALIPRAPSTAGVCRGTGQRVQKAPAQASATGPERRRRGQVGAPGQPWGLSDAGPQGGGCRGSSLAQAGLVGISGGGGKRLQHAGQIPPRQTPPPRPAPRATSAA